MPIQGNIEEAGLPDVLQLLSLGRKSGCLTLVDGETQGHIYLDVGRISYATVANRLDRLGDMLVKNGRITQQQLNAAVEEQGQSNKRQLGRILVDSGKIDRAELERFIRLQVEQAVYYLFTWKQGTFSFTSDRLPPHQPLLVSLDAEGLLLEGARRVDEWSLIQKKVPSFDLVYRSTRDQLGSSADGLTDEQKRILSLLDGTRDVAAIIDATAMSEFEVGKALYGLITAGLAQLVERRAHLRHLEYRDLLAYVVREAEYADPQRRKEAARHIVDCQTCAERLRSIHVRRSTGVGMIAVDDPATIVETARSTLVPPPAQAPRPQTVARQSPVSTATPAPRPQTVARQSPVPPPPPGPRPQTVARQSPVSTATQAPRPQTVARQSPVPPPAPGPKPQTVAPSAPPPQKAVSDSQPAVAEAVAVVEWPDRDRRTVRDRRAVDRRAGVERRHAMRSGTAQPSIERRKGPRRDDDRREDVPRDRRGADVATRPGAATAVASGWSADAGTTGTGPPPPFHAPEQGREPQADLAVAVDLSAIEISPVAAEMMLLESPSETVAPPPSPSEPEVTGSRDKAASAGEEVGGGGIEWLVSPRESLDMIRASQTQLRAMTAATGDLGQAAAGSPAAAPTVDRRSPPATQAVPDGAMARTEPRRIERFRGSPSAARPADSAKAASPAVPRQAFPLRSLAVAAVIACVALIGYMAGQLGRQGRAGRVNEANEPSTLAPSVAQAQPPAGARPSESSARGSAAVEAPAGPVPSAAQPKPEVQAHPAPDLRAAVPATTPKAEPRAAAPAQPSASPRAQPQAPAPTVGVIRGVVRDAAGGTVAGARVTVRGTSLSAVADGSGAFEIRDVPDGQAALQASAEGYVAGSAQVRATAGAAVAADLTLGRVPAAPAPAPAAPVPASTAGEPDRELAAGGWAVVDRAEATTILGGTLGAIQGLSIESVAKSTAGNRTRVRVAQLTQAGERIVLTETRAGAAVRGGSGPAVVTALRVMPASEAYPWSTGTASLGNILVTVKTSLSADVLRPLLQRLAEVPGQ